MISFVDCYIIRLATQGFTRDSSNSRLQLIQSICCKLLCPTLPHLPQFLLQFYHLRGQIKVINFAMGSCYISRLVIVAFFVSVIIIVRFLFSVLYNVKLNESLFTRDSFRYSLRSNHTHTHIHLTLSSHQLHQLDQVEINCV